MINEHAIGRITDITEEGLAVIHAALPNLKHALDRHYDEVEIILPDARRITAKAVYDSFPDYDGSGYLLFTPKASRKSTIVPPLTAALEKWTESGSQSQLAADE